MDARELLDANGHATPFEGVAATITREQVAPDAYAALRAVLDEADKAEHGATRWADPLPVPEWVDTIRAAITTALEAS